MDFIERVGTSTVTVFPLYDGHGNMVATLSRNGTSYSLNDQRSYGAWGEIRTGASTGDPKGRYVANLGHKQDDESGLIYMRARYYEPSRGRFISEDPAMHGDKWFVYAENQPTNKADATGKWAHLLIAFLAGFLMGAISGQASGQGWLAGGLIGGFSATAGALFSNPVLAGAVSGFLSSIASDLSSGGLGNVNLTKAVLSAGLGGGTGAMAAKAASLCYGRQLEISRFFVGDDVLGAGDTSGAEGVIGAHMGVFGEAS